MFPAWTLAALLGNLAPGGFKGYRGLAQGPAWSGSALTQPRSALPRSAAGSRSYAERKLLASTDEHYRQERRAMLSEARRERHRADISRSTVGAILLRQERGEFHDALSRAREAIALARDQKDRPSEALTLAALAEIQAELGYTGEADELAEAAQRIGGQDSQPRALRVLGKVRRRWRHSRLPRSTCRKA